MARIVGKPNTGVNPPGENSKYLQSFKEKVGLPTAEEIKGLLEGGFADQVIGRVKVMQQYAIAQQMLYQTMTAMDWKVANSLHNIVDLQSKLWTLEEDLRQRGENPLENDAWMRARELLGKEVQFVQKQGLDTAKFQVDVQKNREALGDDDLFKVEAREV
jgi:hypothetical protein